jgi:hypothetical protein
MRTQSRLRAKRTDSPRKLRVWRRRCGPRRAIRHAGSAVLGGTRARRPGCQRNVSTRCPNLANRGNSTRPKSAPQAAPSVPVDPWPQREQARQAGGHWFEPSTAHHNRCKTAASVYNIGDAVPSMAISAELKGPIGLTWRRLAHRRSRLPTASLFLSAAWGCHSRSAIGAVQIEVAR